MRDILKIKKLLISEHDIFKNHQLFYFLIDSFQIILLRKYRLPIISSEALLTTGTLSKDKNNYDTS